MNSDSILFHTTKKGATVGEILSGTRFHFEHEKPTKIPRSLLNGHVHARLKSRGVVRWAGPVVPAKGKKAGGSGSGAVPQTTPNKEQKAPKSEQKAQKIERAATQTNQNNKPKAGNKAASVTARRLMKS
tara:strand:+ start:262 stop:648 length:387 start_codon:yes stop_codon:yes gene_type:complete